jgi:DNA adenine methylase
MKYVGGKHGIGKRIAHFLVNQCNAASVNGYLEPFCGSLGVFKHMTDKEYKNYIASDKQADLIEMWKKLQKNTLHIPKNISEEEYNRLKNAKSPNAMKAVAGFGLSFGGKYFAGYSQKWAGKSGRNFLNEFKNSIEKIKPTIQKKNVVFYNKSYTDFTPHNMLIYCDPPYKSTQGYSTGDFDHELFWDTMRKWSKDNCVFISEESAPSDFKVVFKISKRRTLDKTSRFYRDEKVYSYQGGTTKHSSKIKSTNTRKVSINKTSKNKTSKNKKL